MEERIIAIIFETTFLRSQTPSVNDVKSNGAFNQRRIRYPPRHPAHPAANRNLFAPGIVIF